ncbi:hypothetical protein I3843_11G105200 [Carya illinoinensis]|nr:hypothetical protein I3843_11G105200 [Carya illinoinensis]
MRPVPEPVAVVAAAAAPYVIHLPPPISSTTTTTSRCETHACRRQPHSNSSGDFEANVAIVLIVLLCALICALALNGAIRCFLRGGNDRHAPPTDSSSLPEREQQLRHQRKDAMEKGAADDPLVAAPTLVFSAGMKLAGTEAECAICLSEFVEGERIRVLGKCTHGFHAHCIEEWFSSQASCPTCRSSCLPASPSSQLPST